MWQTALEYEPVMDYATDVAANLGILPLQTLARLNFLPAWWILRNTAKQYLLHAGYIVDDRSMEMLYQETSLLYRPPQALQGPASHEAIHAPRRNGVVAQMAQQEDDGGFLKVDQEGPSYLFGESRRED